MKWMKNRYNKPGPGVSKDEPRKKGFARFFELLARHLGDLCKLNLLMQVCFLPTEALLFLALRALSKQQMGYFGFCVFLLIASGLLAGPALSSGIYCISKMLMDEPSFIFHDFKKCFKENFKVSSVAGVVALLLLGLIFVAIRFYSALTGAPGFLLKILCLLALLLFLMAIPNFLIQVCYLDLGLRPMIKNSFLLSMGFLPRGLLGALLGYGPLLVQFVLFPILIVFTLLLGYSLPLLMQMICLWKPIDETFKIEETLRKRRDEHFSALDAPR